MPGVQAARARGWPFPAGGLSGLQPHRLCRTGIHELYVIDDEQRRLIHEGAGEQQLRLAAQRTGMKLMREDGERWVRDGQTAPEEIIRVTRDGWGETMANFRFEAADAQGAIQRGTLRRLCPECKRPAPEGGHFLPVGCPACNHTGYRGRTGIHELYVIDDEQRRLIHEGAGEQQLRLAAQRMKLMREDGERWVRDGQTAPEEIIRVTRDG